jgi:hypothetical protein
MVLPGGPCVIGSIRKVVVKLVALIDMHTWKTEQISF